jgi:hypothetical protein
MSGIMMSTLTPAYSVTKLPLPVAATSPPSNLLSLFSSELCAASPIIPDPIFLARTPTEFSVICPTPTLSALSPQFDEASKASYVIDDDSWVCFMVHGPMPFDLVGIMATLSQVLAKASISLLAQSTFDTDYVLVKAGDADAAKQAFVGAGVEWQ